MTPVRRTTAKRRGTAGARRLRVVRRASPAAPPPAACTPAFPQRAGASPRQLALFEIVRARAGVIAAVHGISAATAEMPTRAPRRAPAPRPWSIRELVLHLHAWDLEWERVLEPALNGVRPAWMDYGRRELARLNETLLAPLRAVPWDEAVRRLHAGHARLLEAAESLPDEPATLWTREHPLGGILALIPEHDRHHAEVVQQVCIAATPSPRTP